MRRQSTISALCVMFGLAGMVSSMALLAGCPGTMNTAPIADAGAPQVAVPGTTVTLNGSGSSDPDGDALTFQWTQTGGTGVILADASQAVTTFTAGTVSETLTFSFQVRDEQYSSTATTTVTVTPTERPIPVSVSAGPDSSSEPGGSLNLTATVTDGTAPFSFQWLEVGAGNSGSSQIMNSASQAATVIFSADASGTFTYQVTVTDANGMSAQDLVVVTVQAPGGDCANLNCDDGLFCNGLETCSGGQCQAGSNPCPPGKFCNESANRCVDCLSDGQCDDGLFCTGQEVCNNGDCDNGTPPCAAGLTCDEVTHTCICGPDAACDDGLFCNGQEVCNNGVCQNGTPPCAAGQTCDEATDTCEPPPCTTDMFCDDGLFCNGMETCSGGQCQSGSDPCAAGQTCDETNDRCVSPIEWVYFADSGRDTISRISPDGLDFSDPVTGQEAPRGIAVDSAAGKVYWTDVNADAVMRANLNGSGVETIVFNTNSPTGLALDPSGNRIYWLNNQGISRATLSGGSPEVIVSGLGGTPWSLAIDAVNQRLYWTNQGSLGGTDGSLWRLNLSDLSTAPVVVTGITLRDPRGVAVDVPNNRIYWTDILASAGVYSAPLDGGPGTLVCADAGQLNGIALDLSSRRIYWTNSSEPDIKAGNMDGPCTPAVVSLAVAIGSPQGIALYSPP